eukprot:SAG11_NODE_35643_length_265_cov_1.674699_1_plen_72_part_10
MLALQQYHSSDGEDIEHSDDESEPEDESTTGEELKKYLHKIYRRSSITKSVHTRTRYLVPVRPIRYIPVRGT